jgi:hypothetical protein
MPGKFQNDLKISNEDMISHRTLTKRNVAFPFWLSIFMSLALIRMAEPGFICSNLRYGML